jgi:hypothetical protein
MIRLTRAFTDSEGKLHATREDACKAEFQRMLLDKFLSPKQVSDLRPEDGIKISALVDGLFDLDKMIAEACKEDTRYEASGDTVTAPS